MLTQDPKKKKTYRILLDIVVTLMIISLLIGIINLIGIDIGISSFFSTILWLILLITMFKFAKLTKKYLYIVLFFLFLLGVIMGLLAINVANGEMLKSFENTGTLGTEIELPQSFYIYSYMGSIFSLVSLISLIIFYFSYYRKYLSGESLYNLGVDAAENEQQFTQQYQEKEKKHNKVGWIIVIILVLIFVGMLIFMSLM